MCGSSACMWSNTRILCNMHTNKMGNIKNLMVTINIFVCFFFWKAVKDTRTCITCFCSLYLPQFWGTQSPHTHTHTNHFTYMCLLSDAFCGFKTHSMVYYVNIFRKLLYTHNIYCLFACLLLFNSM